MGQFKNARRSRDGGSSQGRKSGGLIKVAAGERWREGEGKAERRGTWERLRTADHDRRLSITSSPRFNAHPAGEPVLCESSHGRWDSAPPVYRCVQKHKYSSWHRQSGRCLSRQLRNESIFVPLGWARKGLLNTKDIYSLHNVSNSAATSERPSLGPSSAIGLWGAAEGLAFTSGISFLP